MPAAVFAIISLNGNIETFCKNRIGRDHPAPSTWLPRSSPGPPQCFSASYCLDDAEAGPRHHLFSWKHFGILTRKLVEEGIKPGVDRWSLGVIAEYRLGEGGRAGAPSGKSLRLFSEQPSLCCSRGRTEARF